MVVHEVQNSTFFPSPNSACTLRDRGAFDDHQFALGGSPFVGAKLGNLLQRVGFAEIETEVCPVLLDHQHPGERAEFLQFWTDLLLSGCEELIGPGEADAETVEGMQRELREFANDPDAVLFYAFVQAGTWAA